MKKIITALGACAMMAACGSAMAWHGGYGHGPHCGQGMGPGAMAQQDLADHVTKGYAAAEKMLGLKGRQQVTFENYTKAVIKGIKDRQEWRAKQDKPCTDAQQRIERRAERARLAAGIFEEVAKARKAFVATLDERQKATFEMFESRHGMFAGRGMGMRHGQRPGCGMQGANPDCPNRAGNPDCAMRGPRMHGGPGYMHHQRPGCGMMQK